VTIPFVPGLWSQTFQIPCLFTHSEARAIFAAGILIPAGLLVMFAGVQIMVTIEVAKIALSAVGLRGAVRSGVRNAAPSRAPAVTQADVTPAA
jgi:hypothetical protein